MSGALRGAPISAVLFDYGGTLVRFERPGAALDAAYARIEEHLRGCGFTPPAAAVLVGEVHDRVEAAFAAHQRSGRLEEIDLVAEAQRAYAGLGLALDAATLDEVLRMEQEAWWQGVTVDPGAVPALEALRAAGLRLGLCSNAPYRVRSMHDQLAHLGLDRHLDAITFSGQVGWRKPSPRLFEAALAALGQPAATTVMVGDSIGDDVEGAAAAGMRAIWLRPPEAAAAGHEAPGTAVTVDQLSCIRVILSGTVAL